MLRLILISAVLFVVASIRAQQVQAGTGSGSGAPVIHKQPVGHTVSAGDKAFFSVNATGNPAPQFQWAKNGIPIPGATKSTYTILSARTEDAADYLVAVYNRVGSVLSSPANLRVCSFDLESSYRLVNASGGITSVGITNVGMSPCVLTFQYADSWFTVERGTNFSAVNFLVQPNPSTRARAGVLKIAGKRFVINQLGLPISTDRTFSRKTIVFHPTEGTGVLQSTQTVVFVTTANNLWRQVGLGDFETYEVQQTGDTTALLSITDGSFLSLSFESNFGGTGTYSIQNGDFMTGSFVLSRSRPDFNGDGLSDLLWQRTNGAVRASFMNGNTSLGTANLGQAHSWRVAGASDVNADGHADIILQDSNYHLKAWIMQGANYVTTAFLGWLPGRRLAGIEDFNADGENDFVFQNTNGVIEVWFRKGGRFDTVGRVANLVPPGFKLAHVVDLNQDGETDVILQHPDGRLACWLMNGTDRVLALWLKSTSSSWRLVGSSDINLDGHPDLIFSHLDGRAAAWLMNKTKFTQAMVISDGNPPDSSWRLVWDPLESTCRHASLSIL